MVGPILALIGGILGFVGALVPLGTNISVTLIPITFSGSFFLLDPIFMILGGITRINFKKINYLFLNEKR